MYKYSSTLCHVTWVRKRMKCLLSSLNTFLPFPRTRKCHYQWFRRCKERTCCSFFCNFATRARMDWEGLFVIVRLSAPATCLMVSLSRTSSFSVCVFISLFLPLYPYKVFLCITSIFLFSFVAVGFLSLLFLPLPQQSTIYFLLLWSLSVIVCLLSSLLYTFIFSFIAW